MNECVLILWQQKNAQIKNLLHNQNYNMLFRARSYGKVYNLSPPSTNRLLPVTYEERGLARKSAPSATSVFVPSLCRGHIMDSNDLFLSSAFPPVRETERREGRGWVKGILVTSAYGKDQQQHKH